MEVRCYKLWRYMEWEFSTHSGRERSVHGILLLRIRGEEICVSVGRYKNPTNRTKKAQWRWWLTRKNHSHQTSCVCHLPLWSTSRSGKSEHKFLHRMTMKIFGARSATSPRKTLTKLIKQAFCLLHQYACRPLQANKTGIGLQFKNSLMVIFPVNSN